MNIVCIAGFATITRDKAASAALYRDGLGFTFRQMGDYLYVDGFDGAKHFGIWPLEMAAQACFGRDDWPADVPVPQATIEYELADVAAVEAAVLELKARGVGFVHDMVTAAGGDNVFADVQRESV